VTGWEIHRAIVSPGTLGDSTAVRTRRTTPVRGVTGVAGGFGSGGVEPSPLSGHGGCDRREPVGCPKPDISCAFSPGPDKVRLSRNHVAHTSMPEIRAPVEWHAGAAACVPQPNTPGRIVESAVIAPGDRRFVGVPG